MARGSERKVMVEEVCVSLVMFRRCVYVSVLRVSVCLCVSPLPSPLQRDGFQLRLPPFRPPPPHVSVSRSSIASPSLRPIVHPIDRHRCSSGRPHKANSSSLRTPHSRKGSVFATMATASVLGWASVGFLTRCYQLGLQKRNIFESEYAGLDR